MIKQIIHDAITGEETVIEFTAEEIKKIKAEQKAQAELETRQLAEAQAKEAARQSALEKLAALGLTEAEIAALAG